MHTKKYANMHLPYAYKKENKNTNLETTHKFTNRKIHKLQDSHTTDHTQINFGYYNTDKFQKKSRAKTVTEEFILYDTIFTYES